MSLYKSLKGQLSKNYVTLSFTILFSIILIVFVIRPLILHSIGDRRYINEAEIVQKRLRHNIDDMHNIHTVHENYKAEVNLLHESIPDDPDEGGFLKTIQSLSYKYNLNIIETNFTYSQPMTLTFKIKLEGPYDKFINLIDDINHLLRITTVDSIEVKIPKEQVGNYVVAEIDGRSYYSPSAVLIDPSKNSTDMKDMENMPAEAQPTIEASPSAEAQPINAQPSAEPTAGQKPSSTEQDNSIQNMEGM